ncbi:SDR family oxidoreductase [Planctomycetes bacterium K23_9]|uniref:NAD dependent epimerase/dehydratase family protein n=1 Tax=Stieleria marina TaxID=1930275 RepID=A0A517NMG7_9BACT|nr:NAD dependent epimerase/dehydratase family protein [Planctomycetes bacterium K23_9]
MTQNSAKNDNPPLRGEAVLVVGGGYLGSRVARAARDDGANTYVTTRNPDRAKAFSDAGLSPLVLDWTDRRSLAKLPSVSRILVAVSYDSSSSVGRYESQVGGLKNLLRATPASAKMCYISTTGVYHQSGGLWVDENSPAQPIRQGGRAHLDAEAQLHRHRPNDAWTILRLSGIYGPGRVPRAADVIAGRAIRSPSDGYLNLIHVDDAVTAVMATWQTQCRRLYVVSDDQPMIRGDFYREIARQCGAAEPNFLPPDPDAPVSMRSGSNKRIWNRRMKHDLVPKLRYPTYREGLADVLKCGSRN